MYLTSSSNNSSPTTIHSSSFSIQVMASPEPDQVPTRTEDISYRKRCYVQALRYAGWTFQQIADDQALAVSTVYGICNSPATPQREGRCGRPLILDTPTRRQLVFAATATAESRRKPWSDVAEEIGIRVSAKTLRAAFAKEGYHRRVARKKPFLNESQRNRRLTFALAHRNWTERQWRGVVWTDECYIWLEGSFGRLYVTRNGEEEWIDDCIAPKFAKQDSIMIWGAILGDGGKKIIVIWEKDNWGSITARTYINDILIPRLQPFWLQESQRTQQNLWLMEDGAPAHRARSTQLRKLFPSSFISNYIQNFRDQFGIPSLNWPASSPDLNPIENIWSILKRRLHDRRPRPRGKAAITEAVLEEWDLITEEDIDKCIRNMSERIEAVIAANGGHTRW